MVLSLWGALFDERSGSVISFQKLDIFPFSGEGREIPTVLQTNRNLISVTGPLMRLALSKKPNRVGVSLPLSEDGHRPSFRKAVFSSYLELRTVDKVQTPSDSECYTPSSELFRFYIYIKCFTSEFKKNFDVTQSLPMYMSKSRQGKE
jgi:hypothetical protein